MRCDKEEKGELGRRSRQFEGGKQRENERAEDGEEREREKGDLTCQEQCY